MHELFTQVLGKKDLSRAGDLFTVNDAEIANDLTEVIKTISEITSNSDYVNNDNDQSVVEICITRVTSAIRETGSMEIHADALVSLLQNCLNHSLKPTCKDEDPPHAKIAADIISCIFLNYNKKEVMKKALPVAVKFLHKGNKELSRNMSSYLSLAAIENAELLSQHIQLIIDSIISGNYTLSRVLPQVYGVDKAALEEHVMALVSLLPLCNDTEKLALLNLFALIANNKPHLLELSLHQLCEYLNQSSTAPVAMQIFLNVAEKKPQSLVDHLPRIKACAERYPNTLCIAAKIISSVGKLSKDRAEEALNFVLEHLQKADRGCQGPLLKEATLLCSSYPLLFTEKMLAEVRLVGNHSDSNSCNGSAQVNQTSGNITIVKLGGASINQVLKDHEKSEVSRSAVARPRSTVRLDNTTPHRSMTRLNVGGSRVGSFGGLHKSMTRLSSSQQINLLTTSKSHIGNTPSKQCKVTSGGVTVTTTMGSSSPTKSITGSSSALKDDRDSNVLTSSQLSTLPIQKEVTDRHFMKNLTTRTPSNSPLHNLTSSLSSTSNLNSGQVSVNTPLPITLVNQSMPTVTQRRHNNSNITIINNNPPPSQRISVFEPYPMRDTVQHFCEKHLDKIKAYMEKVSVRIPPPAKCTIEERRAKKLAKLHFACQGRGEHCLYKRTFFTMKTRNPRTWIHLMFLTLQARSQSALNSRDPSVSSLKNCWDILKCENKTFLTLVTSAFPCVKDQEAILNELRTSGFEDVFECVKSPTGPMWGCFLCNHPEKAMGFLQDSQPVIEGQLKEKKGKWKIFKRWRTRYFTLSGAHLSYKVSKDDKDVTPIEVNQIRSVKVSRGARNIPKAFEIFTGDQSLILKPKGGKNVEEWVQCLSIVVAHSQSKELPVKSHSLPARTVA
ncbi:hypothetical protein RUM43_014073 [Polyplax serrata]|uniref:PH domain-containing protein n=1 Tax=Polyplax serrata TaxID=468196 RepID=A0AAN8NJ05_POLSC